MAVHIYIAEFLCLWNFQFSLYHWFLALFLWSENIIGMISVFLCLLRLFCDLSSLLWVVNKKREKVKRQQYQKRILTKNIISKNKRLLSFFDEIIFWLKFFFYIVAFSLSLSLIIIIFLITFKVEKPIPLPDTPSSGSSPIAYSQPPLAPLCHSEDC